MDNKNRTIWIIEDEYYDYSIIRKTLLGRGYNIFPNCDNEDSFTEFEIKLIEYVNKGNLEDYVKESMKEHSFAAIVCDIRLGENDTNNSGEKIIKYIRLNTWHIHSLENTLPVFIMTKYANTGKNAIKYGAYYSRKYFKDNYRIEKDPEEIFLTRLEYRISEFESDKRINDILKPSFDEYQNMMIKHNKMVESHIDNIKVIFQSNSENILSEFNSSFGLLLKLSLEQFKHSNINAYEQFANKFDEEIINEIGQVEYDELINEIKKVSNTWGGSFKELLKNGSIEDAVKYLGATLAIPSGGISSLVAFSINLLIKNLK